MLEKLSRMYERAKNETPPKDREGVYVRMEKKLLLSRVPSHIQQLLDITGVDENSGLRIEFGHFSQQPLQKPQNYTESFSFTVRWKRPARDPEAEAEIDGVYFSIKPVGNGKLHYDLHTGSSISNMRSDRRQIDLLGRDNPEYLEIIQLIKVRQFQEELLGELIEIFLGK